MIGQSKNAYKLAMGIKNINRSFAEGKTGLPNVFTYIKQNLTTKKSRPLMLFTEGGIIDKLAYEYIEQILLGYHGQEYASKIIYIRDSQTENDNF